MMDPRPCQRLQRQAQPPAGMTAEGEIDAMASTPTQSVLFLDVDQKRPWKRERSCEWPLTTSGTPRMRCTPALIFWGKDLQGQHVKHDGKEGEDGDAYGRQTQLPSLLMCGFGFCGGLFDGGHRVL